MRGANFVVGPGPDAPVFIGGVLELIVALACIGTAVALYPVVKRQNQGVALGSLLYKSRLVPRVLPLPGFIGAPLLIASTTATVFGVNGYASSWSALAAVPIAAWEFSLGVYLVVKGFKPSSITAGMVAAGSSPAHRDVVA